MVGILGKNLRQGNLAEGIAIELLRTFAAVAPVPRTEDTGIDAICTLLEPCKLKLLADRSFQVQIKATSVRTIEYHDDAYDWLLGLQIPIYLASSDLMNAEVSLYTMQRAVNQLSDDWRGVTVYLDTTSNDDGEHYDNAPNVIEGIHHICLGPPILKWSTKEASTDQFRNNAFKVMKKWIQWEETNQCLRHYRCCIVPRWRTNENPEWSHSSYRSDLNEDFIRDFSQRFSAAMLALYEHCDSFEIKKIIQFIKFLETKGIKSNEMQIVKLALLSKINFEVT